MTLPSGLAGQPQTLPSDLEWDPSCPHQDASLGVGGEHRLLWLRNPWADGHEWNGDWSDKSPLWERHPAVAAELRHRCDKKADGLFWMSWEDFSKRICVLNYVAKNAEVLFTTTPLPR